MDFVVDEDNSDLEQSYDEIEMHDQSTKNAKTTFMNGITDENDQD